MIKEKKEKREVKEVDLFMSCIYKCNHAFINVITEDVKESVPKCKTIEYVRTFSIFLLIQKQIASKIQLRPAYACIQPDILIELRFGHQLLSL